MIDTTDWQQWHSPYDDPQSSLSQRLVIVQAAITSWLGSCKQRSRVLSACAGDGRDVLGVLAARLPDSPPSLTLVELDGTLASRAREAADSAGLSSVSVRCADAGLSDSYIGAVPADLVLLCGIFGNISDADTERVIRATPQLCAAGATVIWTRTRRAPDLTPRLREWFADAGFEEQSFTAPAAHLFTVGVHVYRGTPEPLAPGVRLFSFDR